MRKDDPHGTSVDRTIGFGGIGAASGITVDRRIEAGLDQGPSDLLDAVEDDAVDELTLIVLVVSPRFIDDGHQLRTDL